MAVCRLGNRGEIMPVLTALIFIFARVLRYYHIQKEKDCLRSEDIFFLTDFIGRWGILN